MRVILNEQGYVDSYALIGTFGEQSIEVAEPENLEDFENNYDSYYLSKSNTLVKSDDKQKEIEDQRELSVLRSQREKVCFSYINRGELWYSKLTLEQKEELDTWYQAWLDVTDTKVVPETPDWLH
jgi:hypothetical protein